MDSRVLLCFLLAVAIASVDCNLEGDILHSWKTILVDPNNVLASWNRTDSNPCTWFHVTCNSENLVTRLDLGNAGLSGPIIPALANLTSLQYLELYQNKFYGSIPSEFGHLSKLVSLDLYQNHLSGSIPETFGHFDSLRYLRVFHNNLSGPIPMSLGNLTSLQILKLNKNRLTGTLPVEVIQIVRFGNLRLLDVSNNLLAGTVPRSNSTGTPEQIRIPNKLILEKIIPSGSTVTFSAASVLRLQKSYKIQELRTKAEESDEHEVEEDNLC